MDGTQKKATRKTYRFIHRFESGKIVDATIRPKPGIDIAGLSIFHRREVSPGVWKRAPRWPKGTTESEQIEFVRHVHVTLSRAEGRPVLVMA